MKRIIIVLVVGLVALTDANGQKNTQTTDCSYRPETKQLVKALDSLANFVKNIKANVVVNDWNSFVSEAENGKGLDAFDMLGNQGGQLRSGYELVRTDASVKLSNLIAAIDPGNEKPVEEVKRIILKEMNCFISDTVENSLHDRLAGGDIGVVLAGGPCEREARTCFDNAINSYTSNMLTCGFGGLAVGHAATGWWGLATGGGCALIANIRYNNAKWTCIENYVDCIH